MVVVVGMVVVGMVMPVEPVPGTASVTRPRYTKHRSVAAAGKMWILGLAPMRSSLRAARRSNNRDSSSRLGAVAMAVAVAVEVVCDVARSRPSIAQPSSAALCRQDSASLQRRAGLKGPPPFPPFPPLPPLPPIPPLTLPTPQNPFTTTPQAAHKNRLACKLDTPQHAHSTSSNTNSSSSSSWD